MTQNIGILDRNVRIVAGLALVAWGLYAQNWLGAVGLVALATGLLRWCPAYLPLGLNANR